MLIDGQFRVAAPPARVLALLFDARLTRGEEGGNASTLQATSEVRLAPDADGTRVDYRSEVAVTGRLGRFALGMMKKKAQSLGDEFASNLQARLADGATGPAAALPAAAATSAPVMARTSEATEVQPTEPVAARATQPMSAWHRLVHWLRRALGLEPRTSAPPPAPSGPQARH